MGLANSKTLIGVDRQSNLRPDDMTSIPFHIDIVFCRWIYSVRISDIDSARCSTVVGYHFTLNYVFLLRDYNLMFFLQWYMNGVIGFSYKSLWYWLMTAWLSSMIVLGLVVRSLDSAWWMRDAIKLSSQFIIAWMCGVDCAAIRTSSCNILTYLTPLYHTI
jgi:hypothetical protein